MLLLFKTNKSTYAIIIMSITDGPSDDKHEDVDTRCERHHDGLCKAEHRNLIVSNLGERRPVSSETERVGYSPH